MSCSCTSSVGAGRFKEDFFEAIGTVEVEGIVETSVVVISALTTSLVESVRLNTLGAFSLLAIFGEGLLRRFLAGGGGGVASFRSVNRARVLLLPVRLPTFSLGTLDNGGRSEKIFLRTGGIGLVVGGDKGNNGPSHIIAFSLVSVPSDMNAFSRGNGDGLTECSMGLTCSWLEKWRSDMVGGGGGGGGTSTFDGGLLRSAVFCLVVCTTLGWALAALPVLMIGSFTLFCSGMVTLAVLMIDSLIACVFSDFDTMEPGC